MGDCVNVKLREIRARYRVSQEKLARAVGVTRQTIIAIEAGKYLPSLTLALKIASYFNLRVEEIFTLTDKCRPSKGTRGQ
ncbi:MAG: helix-turn-helix transcriptional regulator [Desulfurococcales archaeon]|nr:helix-turn-helix transcriptional regulator [Desulfurococcales archaeon]